MSSEHSISVNFGKPLPVFPLDSVVLLPQQVIPLHIFEPRYRQMIAQALDAAGQIAMAVFAGDAWKSQYHGRPPLRPAVCVGQIVQHETTPDGRYNLLLQGVCRARILRESPASSERLYREALLQPVGLEEGDPGALDGVRERLEEMLTGGPAGRMTAAEPVLKFIRNHEVPVATILELVSFTMLNQPRFAYQLLEEGDVQRRAEMVIDELDHLAGLIRRASLQRHENLPRGCSWN